MIKKLFSSFLCATLFLGVFAGVEVFAQKNDGEEEIYEYEHIPAKMEPYSKIRFIDDTHYIILEGRNVEDEEQYSHNGVPKPKAGLIVTYASDGFILKTFFPDNIENPYADLDSDSVPEVELYAYIFDGEEYDKVATWGSNRNTLYQAKNSNKMIGIGRATTFSPVGNPPSINGCYGNKLKKGDIALKMAYDNCANGGTVNVDLQKKSGERYNKNMTKGDHGAMPDAIVDVWYTGVEYWGYTYSLSLSFPGTATIKYQGNGRL